MPREFPRTHRINEQIRRDLADLIRSEGDDPRLIMVSITAVEVSRDLSYGRVYVTYLGAAEERQNIIAALNQLAPSLRHQLGRKMHIRSIPSLQFIYDNVIEQGAELSDLITRTVAADEKKRHLPGTDESET